MRIQPPDSIQWYRRALLVAAFVFALVPPPTAAGPARQAAPELDLKCVYLYNFARFTTWPAATHASAKSPFTFAILGDPDLAANLRRLLQGRQIGDHPILVSEALAPNEWMGAQVIYIGAGQQKSVGEVLTACERRAILTVGESASFLRQGGVVRMVRVDEHLRFEINQHAATISGLRISSRLLQLARQVVGVRS